MSILDVIGVAALSISISACYGELCRRSGYRSGLRRGTAIREEASMFAGLHGQRRPYCEHQPNGLN
jgi:hypothetical protein